MHVYIRLNHQCSWTKSCLLTGLNFLPQFWLRSFVFSAWNQRQSLSCSLKRFFKNVKFSLSFLILFLPSHGQKVSHPIKNVSFGKHNKEDSTNGINCSSYVEHVLPFCLCLLKRTQKTGLLSSWGWTKRNDFEFLWCRKNWYSRE